MFENKNFFLPRFRLHVISYYFGVVRFAPSSANNCYPGFASRSCFAVFVYAKLRDNRCLLFRITRFETWQIYESALRLFSISCTCCYSHCFR